MIVRLGKFALAAAIMSSVPSFADAGPSSDQPVQSLIASANALLAKGDMYGALDHFEAAIKKDPSNYLTIFKRGATYLSLGKSPQASADFDTVLSMKPDFEAALLQRAKLKSKAGDWSAARKDYKKAGSSHREKIAEIDETEKAVLAAVKAEERGDYEACVSNAGNAVMLASGMPSLRSLRAKCRLQRGEVHEAIGDLTHLVQLAPGNIDPHLQIANLLYFSINDYERSVAQLRKCLHSDPDSKPCSKAFRRIKNLEKSVAKAKALKEKRQFNSAAKLLVGVGGEPGVIDEVKEDMEEIKKLGYYSPLCPQELLLELQEMACEAYTEMNNLKKGKPHCEEALKMYPGSLPGLLAKASRLIEEELFEEAVRVLEVAKEAHSQDVRVNQKLQDAHTLLRRSKAKDYYKVLGVVRDAGEREIKRAYRKLTKQYHPDKYRGDLTPEEVQRKQSSINEAYEVLSNPELRQRFDMGDDPNSQEHAHPFAQGGHPFGGFGGGSQQFMFRGGPPGGGGGQFKFHF